MCQSKHQSPESGLRQRLDSNNTPEHRNAEKGGWCSRMAGNESHSIRKEDQGLDIEIAA